MTPAERPTGFVLTDRAGRLAHGTVYSSLSRAEQGVAVAAGKGIVRTPEPVWTRAAWEAEMARRADA